jgi:diguanylate cyclase (GGDEF)-like protein
VIERAGIEGHWPDFLKAYGLPPILDVESRASAGYGDMRIDTLRMNRLKQLHEQINDPSVRQIFEKLEESIYAELVKPGHDRVGCMSDFWDDDEGAVYDLDSLASELEQGGYRFESGRLVAGDAQPTGPEVDKVTGIGNRAYLDRRAARIFAQCRQAGVPCAAVFIDIDRFKAFNDEHDHGTGDAVLRAVAQAVWETVRLRGGVVGRYGGEEIVATVANLTEGEAKALGERMRRDVQRLKVGGLSVTVSVGVASSEEIGNSSEELVNAADRSLKRAKSEGRNRTVAYSELAARPDP